MTALGTCPDCDAAVPETNVLIEYEHGVYAECPECETPVDPE